MNKLSYLAKQAWLGLTAKSSGDYWERRYRSGLSSGDGSYGELAAFKARVLNQFVSQHDVRTVLELGCGDGNQLSLASYPSYIGLDVSARAVELCMERFAADPSKAFMWYDPARTLRLDRILGADLTLSLDVVYHLLEDSSYESYLRDLFGCARRYAIVYSSDRADERPAPHVRHRKFTETVARTQPQFRLIEKIANVHPDDTFADFFIYERK
jgi:SAM-dependent methyltransferase